MKPAIILATLALSGCACADPYHGIDPQEFNQRPLISWEHEEIFGPPQDIHAREEEGVVVLEPEGRERL